MLRNEVLHAYCTFNARRGLKVRWFRTSMFKRIIRGRLDFEGVTLGINFEMRCHANH